MLIGAVTCLKATHRLLVFDILVDCIVSLMVPFLLAEVVEAVYFACLPRSLFLSPSLALFLSPSHSLSLSFSHTLSHRIVSCACLTPLVYILLEYLHLHLIHFFGGGSLK